MLIPFKEISRRATMFLLISSLAGCGRNEADTNAETDRSTPNDDSQAPSHSQQEQIRYSGSELDIPTSRIPIWKGKRGEDIPHGSDFQHEIEDIASLTRPRPIPDPAPVSPHHGIHAIPQPAPSAALFASARSIQQTNRNTVAHAPRPSGRASPTPFYAFKKTLETTAVTNAALISPPPSTGLLPRFPSRPSAICYLSNLSNEELEQYDIAFLNLICRESMSEMDRASIAKSLIKLDKWAAHVAVETEKSFPLFRKNPASFYHSEEYFRILVLVSVLQQDLRVTYNPERESNPTDPEPDESFFSDPKDVFLDGFTDRERPMGTCSSFPVLYTAIAQRLRYPVRLVTARGHLFCRWDDGTNRFNIEATNRGLNCYDDSYYREWPFPMTEQNRTENHHLETLTAREALAVFLSIQGACYLHGNADRTEARESFKYASKLAPHVKDYTQSVHRLTP